MNSPISPGGLGAAATSGSASALGDTSSRGDRLRAYWRNPAGLTILIATAIGLAVRLFMLTRHGFLTGVTEYDDGVYLGGAIRLLQGQLPYHNYAYVQPPGILILMLPAALVSQLTTAVTGMAFARILTVIASAACIPLAGNLVKYRGVLVTIATCGVLAVYPDDISTAHTVLLEPWMNLFCLLAVNAAFRRGRLASPRRLAWAGLLLGIAGAIKFWAIAPAVVLLGVCLLTRDGLRARRARVYTLSIAAGFVVLVAPFAAFGSPLAFIRSTIFDQAARAGSAVPLSLRLAHLTGLIDVINTHGRFSLHAGRHSLFASGSVATTGSASAGWLPFAAAAILIAAIAVGYSWEPRRPSPLEWFSLVTAAIAAVMILSYSAFFYHYPSFVAPWLALTCGGAIGCLSGRHEFRRAIMGCVIVVLLFAAALEMTQVEPLGVPVASPFTHDIPKGSCVVSDEVSLTIAANRFTSSSPGCPDVMDSLATTLVLSGGVSNQGGALNHPAVLKSWQSILGKAQYVLLSTNNERRIPWQPGSSLWIWFYQNFQPASQYYAGLGELFERIPGAS